MLDEQHVPGACDCRGESVVLERVAFRPLRGRAPVLGLSVSTTDGPPGTAARVKLLRSVYLKGRDALIAEMGIADDDIDTLKQAKNDFKSVFKKAARKRTASPIEPTLLVQTNSELTRCSAPSVRSLLPWRRYRRAGHHRLRPALRDVRLVDVRRLDLGDARRHRDGVRAPRG